MLGLGLKTATPTAAGAFRGAPAAQPGHAGLSLRAGKSPGFYIIFILIIFLSGCLGFHTKGML